MTRIGMSVRSNPNDLQAIAACANALESAIQYADACDLWFDGRPAITTLSGLVEQLRDVVKSRARSL